MAGLLRELHTVNQQARLVPPEELYNSAINQDDFDWKADFLTWKRNTSLPQGPAFSFCNGYGCAPLLSLLLADAQEQ